ncbi:metallophosphoesterase [Sediminibacillus massiliensis]|uniref:metallophosphoesterase n=1 Tax=Sediminibacillus massiliensis TaxID=1926277 RepID=UPI00098864EB|nr:metallophosphoesterase [Sediminibacillus massiliensis]
MNILFYSALFILLLYCVTKAYKNTQKVSVKRIQVGDNKSNPGSVLHILHLSDLHLENISISPDELYEKVKDEPIDLIALTGDFLDRKRTIPKLIPYLKILQKLNATHGIYAVLGNHDYVLRHKDLDALINTLQQYDCTVMRNESCTVDVRGKQLNIIGIDDFSTKRSDLPSSYKGLRGGINLVLTHDPNLVLHMKDYSFDYLLSGHFHGGQICYPKPYHLVKMGKLVKMNMIKGLHSRDGKPFYISEGLGQTGVNIRIGSRPEISLHAFSLPEEKAEAWKAAN